MKDLKQLEVLKGKIKSKLSIISKEIETLQKEKKSCEEQLQEMRKSISEILTDVTVSEHAIIRYFERELGYNLDEIKNKILPESIKHQIKQLRNCEFPVNGFRIVVQNNKVVTVVK